VSAEPVLRALWLGIESFELVEVRWVNYEQSGGIMLQLIGRMKDLVDPECNGGADTSNLLAPPNLLRELREVMSWVQPEDLSAAEIVALLGILTPARSRVIGRPTARPRLRVI
jgi:hypothetical protein